MRARWRQRNGCAPHAFHRCRLPMFCARKIGTAFVQLDHENSNSIHRLYSSFAWTVRLLFAPDYLLCSFHRWQKPLFHLQMGAIPTSPRQKGKRHFLASPPALRTQQLVGFRSLATQQAASIPLPARGRSFSTPQTKYGVWRGGAFIQHHRHQQHRRWSCRPFKQYHCRGKHGHWSVRPF